ncbi:hypothetical protein FRB95_009355 [Tulasnella sp. JGI-2019a]|nr:hypothetical protein FRB93_001104 [Tulasnella sp. JGI-2019a]KAG9026148.1 hypothetical protein FRB95_009355 [Tulasnella sp. JGI-2019a]
MNGSKPTPPASPTSAHFSGRDGPDIQQFIQDAQRARASALMHHRESEDVWMQRYIRMRLVDPALT